MRGRLIILLLLASLRISATHIVGGEIIYDYLGNDKYRITLKIYRDCSVGTAAFDGVGFGSNAPPAVLSILEVLNSANIFTVDIGAPVVTRIPPTINSPCIQTPTNICVEEGVYTYTLTLPPKPGGYYVVYQRCCRNNTVLNLFNSGNQGSTYYTKIPGPEDAVINNSPRFKNFPPIFLCNNLNFTFDHSATDPDGDQLVYSLCSPYHGIDGCCTYIGNTFNPPPSQSCPNPPSGCPQVASPPPYQLVTYVTPYTGSYPIASNPSVTINSTTGLLIGRPNLIGQFVVAVCIQEFRNGVLLGTHFRDFQFNISPCVVSVVSAVADQTLQCQGNTINFTNQSTSNVGSLTYHWDFGVGGRTDDTSNVIDPTYTYRDTGIYVLTLIANPGKVCSDTLRKEVYVYPTLKLNFQRPDKQCFKNNSFNFKVRGIYLSNKATFDWNFTDAATPIGSLLENPTGVSFNQPGLYFVKLQGKQFACRDSFSDSVRVVRRPKAKIINLPTAACDPAEILFGNGSTSDLPINYYWSFSNGEVSDEHQPTITLSPAGIYRVRLTVTTTSLCADTSIAVVDSFMVNPKPVANFKISPDVVSIFDPAITIMDEASMDTRGWRYSFGDGQGSSLPSMMHNYKDFGNYIVKQVVTNLFGCMDSVSQAVEVLPEFRFWIPNTFTPDGNAMNDIFKPSLFGIEAYNFEIYDRWGAKIFSTADQNYGWNGKYKETDCKQDVYIWRIVFKNQVSQKQEERCGHVLLSRNE